MNTQKGKPPGISACLPTGTTCWWPIRTRTISLPSEGMNKQGSLPMWIKLRLQRRFVYCLSIKIPNQYIRHSFWKCLFSLNSWPWLALKATMIVAFQVTIPQGFPGQQLSKRDQASALWASRFMRMLQPPLFKYSVWSFK